MNKHLLVIAVITGGLAIASPCRGQAATVREAIEAIVKSVTKSAPDDLAKLGGVVGVERLVLRAAREGDETYQAVVRLHQTYGPDALWAAENATSIAPVLRAVEELNADDAGRALARLAAGTEGRLLAETVESFGVNALKAELRHPGVGGHLVATLGDDGAALAAKLSTDQAILLAKHADDIASLDAAQKAGVLRLFHDDAQRMTAFIGRFVRDHPGKTLFTAAFTTMLLTNPGVIIDPVIGENGKPGIIERTALAIIRPVLMAVLPIFCLGMLGHILLSMWYRWKTGQLRMESTAARLARPVSSSEAPHPSCAQQVKP